MEIAPHLLSVTPPTWGELGVYTAAVLALVGAIYTATATRKTGREANAVEFSNTLLTRINSLEDRDEKRETRMDELEKSQQETDHKLQEAMEILSIALTFIDELFRWGRRGGGEPEPTVPERLRDWLGHLIHRKDGPHGH